jgi:hypothetical protein
MSDRTIPFSEKSGSAGNRTRDLWIRSQELWPLDQGNLIRSVSKYFALLVNLLFHLTCLCLCGYLPFWSWESTLSHLSSNTPHIGTPNSCIANEWRHLCAHESRWQTQIQEVADRKRYIFTKNGYSSGRSHPTVKEPQGSRKRDRLAKHIVAYWYNVHNCL